MEEGHPQFEQFDFEMPSEKSAVPLDSWPLGAEEQAIFSNPVPLQGSLFQEALPALPASFSWNDPFDLSPACSPLPHSPVQADESFLENLLVDNPGAHGTNQSPGDAGLKPGRAVDDMESRNFDVTGRHMQAHRQRWRLQASENQGPGSAFFWLREFKLLDNEFSVLNDDDMLNWSPSASRDTTYQTSDSVNLHFPGSLSGPEGQEAAAGPRPAALHEGSEQHTDAEVTEENFVVCPPMAITHRSSSGETSQQIPREQSSLLGTEPETSKIVGKQQAAAAKEVEVDEGEICPEGRPTKMPKVARPPDITARLAALVRSKPRSRPGSHKSAGAAEQQDYERAGSSTQPLRPRWRGMWQQPVDFTDFSGRTVNQRRAATCSPVVPPRYMYFPRPQAGGQAGEVGKDPLRLPFLQPLAKEVMEIQPGMHSVDAEEALKAQLLEFAEAVASDDQDRIRTLSTILKREATPTGDVMQRLLYYFLDSLWVRSTGAGLTRYNMPPVSSDQDMRDALEDISVYLPLMHFSVEAGTSVVAQAVTGHGSVHIIDFGVWFGGQWPPLLRKLAAASSFPPKVRITSVQFQAHKDVVIDSCESPAQRVAARLADLASQLGLTVEFDYIQVAPEKLQVASLGLRKGEIVAVCCALRLGMLHDASVLRCSPRDNVLDCIRRVQPAVFVATEIHANFNGPFFLSRFREAVDFYHMVFDSHAASMASSSHARQIFEREMMARDLCNVVSCEGLQRVVRFEHFEQLQKRMERVGFASHSVEASVKREACELLSRFPKEWGVEGCPGALKLTWKGKAFAVFSAWRSAQSTRAS